MASTTAFTKSVVSASLVQRSIVAPSVKPFPAGSFRKFSVKSAKLSVSAKLETTTNVVGTSEVGIDAAKAMAGSLFMIMASGNDAMAAQEIAQLAEGDDRIFTLLIILVPAIGWVLFNILQPALNQLNNMKGAKAMIGALGLGAASSLLVADNADAAQEVAQLAADSRPLLLLVILLPAIGWVLFNILKPALRQVESQIEKNSKKRSIIGALGLGASASLLTASDAEAAQEVAQLAADNRPFLLLVILLPAVGWVLFNILKPALRQVESQIEKNSKRK